MNLHEFKNGTCVFLHLYCIDMKKSTWNFWKWGLLFFPEVPITYRKSGVSTKGTHSLLIPMKLL